MILVGSVWNELGESYFIFFCKIFQLGNSVLVLRCKAIALHVIYGFCIKWKVSFIISGPKSFFVLKIAGERFVDSFGECSLICLFWTSHPKREMFDIYMQLWKLFHEFCLFDFSKSYYGTSKQENSKKNWDIIKASTTIRRFLHPYNCILSQECSTLYLPFLKVCSYDIQN